MKNPNNLTYLFSSLQILYFKSEFAMADSILSLNPPKTLRTTIPLNNPISRSACSFRTRITFKSNKFRIPAIRASMVGKEGEQQPSFGETFLNNARKGQVFDAITTSLSNCLSETNLHLTVPALKSKIRGKVSIMYFKHCLILFSFMYLGFVNRLM